MSPSLPGIENLLDHSLCISPKDHVLIASDLARMDLAQACSEHLTERGVGHSIRSMEYDGKSLPPELAALLLDNTHNVIVLLFGNSIWHQPERRTAKYELKKRIASYCGTPDMMSSGPALASPRLLSKLCEDLKPHIENAKRLVLSCPNGTRIEGNCSGVLFETGDYSQLASGGNFPAGEISAYALEENSIEGFVHSNIKARDLGLSSPGNDAIFEVKKGELYPVDGKPAQRFFKLTEKNPELQYVAELAFGISPYKEVFENPDSAQEEKNLGTAHVGLGSSISFGGTRTGKHMDVIFGPATVQVDDKIIVKDGKMNLDFLSPESQAWLKERGMA